MTWTTPAKMMSHAMTALTATAARNGEPIATMPKTISKTPHTMDNVEALRTMSTGVVCAIEASSKRRTNPTPKQPIGALYEQGRGRSQQEISRGRQPWNPTLQKNAGRAPGHPTLSSCAHHDRHEVKT